MKSVSGKVSRSNFNHFITVILPVKQATEQDARFDALGGVMVVSLLVAIISLMRLMLAN